MNGWGKLLGGWLLTLLLGCATQKELVSPVVPPSSFTFEGVETVPDRWWRVFREPELNAHVERALTANFNLESAWQRLRAARALADRTASDQYPDLDALFETEYEQDAMVLDERFALGFVAEYEVDLWGRIRSRTRAERFRAQATYFDYQATALTLAAEVVSTWFALAEAQNQRALLLRQVAINEKVEKSLKARFGGGLIRSADILRQQQLVEATREQVLAVEADIAVLQNQLAVLEGRAPMNPTTYQAEPLPEVPPVPEAGLPSELVQRRPDVREAYYLVKAANQDLAAAISDQYPRITLTASLVSAATNPSDLLNEWIRSMTASLVAPLIDGGERAAEVDRSEAVEAQRLAEYGQTILIAFQEVEDAWELELKQRQRIASLLKQVELAQRTNRRLTIEYFNGVVEYLDVLTALVEEQQLQRDLLEARGDRLQLRVALYRALAGGFETERELAAAYAALRKQEAFEAWQKNKNLKPPPKRR